MSDAVTDVGDAQSFAEATGTDVAPRDAAERLTFATWAVRDGASFHEVALALGTSEKVVREVYGHHSPEHLRSVVERVSRRR